ncbi:MAG: PilN domain-containing protein [Planctomycetota bacterium]
MSRVNLLPQPVRERRRASARRRAWVKGLVAYGLLVVFGGLVSEGLLVAPVGAIEAESAALSADITAADAELALLGEKRESLAGELRVLQEIHGQPDWSILLGHLASELESGETLRSVRVRLEQSGGDAVTPADLARGPFAIEVSGVSSDQTSATGYVLRLERAGLLQDVTLESASQVRVDGADAIAFSLRARLSTEGVRP